MPVFSDKIKGDNAAMLFYTGFPNYEALMSFYNYIEPKVSKMQYWKGEKLLKEIQPYQMDKTRPDGPDQDLHIHSPTSKSLFLFCCN